MKNTPHHQTGHFLSKAKTKNDLIFDPNDDVWIFNDISNTYRLDFNTLHISKCRIYGLKRTFVWYLENNSLGHTDNMFRFIKLLLEYLYELSGDKIILITSSDLINYKSTLTTKREWYLGYLSGFLKKWYKMGFIGLSKDAYNYLLETTFKGAEKGKAVLTMDPYDGPFTDLELEGIQAAINNAYAKGNISQADFLLVWLLMVYGSRPIQFVQLKVCDLLVAKRKDRSEEYIIRIPRAKNRMKFRSEFKERIIPPSLGKVLFSYGEQVKNNFIGILDDPSQAPLFPAKEEKRSGLLAYHLHADEITDTIQKIIDGLDLKSERTEEKLHITSTRFRYTIGTRAASEGHGELIIAEILDHKDTQNAGVYTASTPEIIKRIDKAMALHMAPIAQAFAGILFVDKSKATRADDPTSDIIDPSIDSECRAMGKCGSFGFCGLFAPLACYTCSSFQAWDDGPHEQLLINLLKERERLMKITDYRIASINDKTIFAVAQVVVECDQIKAQNRRKSTQ
ncbi:site-specific integrase [Sulfurovum sp. TSL1]|uniref:site-specific integrase n=1 Tax=Sulfurovum sp. TSL1 TaxID=2826994 RepID=UPI001CC5E3A1|nr:site-specific integrase [Sulfurovum sp. TSL1]GIT99123.1 integrase [Sulfurovum sp. TSL1]